MQTEEKASMEQSYELSMESEWREDTRRAYETIESMGERVRLLSEDDVLEVLEGAIDIHVHAFPDPLIDTGWDQIQITKAASEAGMHGCLFKAHTFPSAATAPFVNQAVEAWAKERDVRAARAYGGIVLNNYVGGLNPESVEMAARLGARCVWLPSHDNAHHLRVLGEPGGIELLDSEDKPVEPLREIFDLVAANDMILDPCHSGTKERFVVIREAGKAGIKRFVVTHPNWNVTKMTLDQQVELSGMGAYMTLFAYGDIPNFNNPKCDPQYAIEAIRRIGPDHMIIGSDLGTVVNAPPVEGMKLFVRILLASGISKQNIRRMCVDNPRELIGV
jgi:predicted metal-dependent TIM-barrel fold hydrolase